MYIYIYIYIYTLYIHVCIHTEDTFDELMADFRPKRSRNLLLRLLFDPSCPTPEHPGQYKDPAGRFALDTSKKGEAAKERTTYSGNLGQWFRQSATERKVDRVMRAHPSYAIGKSGEEKTMMFRTFLAPPVDPRNVTPLSLDDELVVIFCSTDVSGWSEKLTDSAQNCSHEIWDKLFATTAFSQTRDFRVGAYVCMNADGQRCWYKNGTSDFEGFSGKEYTAINVAVSSLAVKRTRARLARMVAEHAATTPAGVLAQFDPATVAVSLMAYIDDAVTRLACPRKYASTVFEVYRDEVVATWARFGFTVDIEESLT